MLNISFMKSEKTIVNVDGYFNLNYEDEWFDDILVKQMIKDVDKSIVISSKCIDSPILGAIPPQLLSGGVKALILLLKEPDIEIWASACGDNCAEWILKISELKDINIVLEHVMNFDRDFNGFCINNHKKIKLLDDYYDCVFDYL